PKETQRLRLIVGSTRATWGRTALSWHRFQAVLLLQVTTAGTQSHGCRCVPHPELQHAAASEEENRVPESCSSAQEALGVCSSSAAGELQRRTPCAFETWSERHLNRATAFRSDARSTVTHLAEVVLVGSRDPH